MRRLWTTLIALAALLAGTTVGPAGAGAANFPDRIELPDGFAPEGIATGRGSSFYTGSLAGMGIWHGDYRTGTGDLLVESGGPFVGMKVDAFGRLWVAGGPAGNGYVFDATTGAPLATFAFATAPTFVNDVVVTRHAAYFTDSMQPAIYRVPIGPAGAIGMPETIPLDPASIGFMPGAFNLNGIEAVRGGRWLVAVNSTAGTLVRIDPGTRAAATIDLGGASVSNGDGILLHGRTLYVLRNQLHVLTSVELSADLATGVVTGERLLSSVDVPTTLARFGSSLYAVNARFGTTDPQPAPYWITRIDR